MAGAKAPAVLLLGTRSGAGAGRPGDRTMSREPRLVEVRKNILKQNDLVARELRQRFRGSASRRRPG